jgi:ribosomal protein L17
MYWRNDNLSKKWCWEKWISICRRLQLDSSPSSCTNINTKWIKDLNIRSEIEKLIQEKIRNSLDNIRLGNNFLNRTLVAQKLRKSIDSGIPWN